MNVHDKRTPSSVTTGAIGKSRKLYSSPAGRADIRVPYRELALDPSAAEPPLRIYDQSGPYGCDSFTPDLSSGLPAARTWLVTRVGLEAYAGRAVKPEDNGFAEGDRLVPPCPATRTPYRAAGDAPVTQLEFARAGIVTEEMIYVAHRENLCRERAFDAAGQRHRRRRELRRGDSRIRDAGIRASTKSRAAGRSFRPISITPNSNR